ncbi:hypothetical protein ACIGXM_03635 [Kitasatospora sp. NPDC052896]|uniref:hypothetical protein n=1 Tax=Kitasatospora sp. NPDC052896 TaxID=3364061 RepID=UPI0037CC2E02
MLVTISTAVIFFLGTVILLWARRLGLFAALIVWLSGFTAAATVVAGPIHALMAAVVAAFH